MSKETDITEQQILNFLLGRYKLLSDEIRKVGLAIEALNSNLPPLDHSNFAEQTTVPTKREEKKISENRQILRSSEFKDFNKKATLDNKILYVLIQLKFASKEDIINALLDLQPDINADKLSKTLSVRLSFLLKKGIINGKKNGRIYTYSLDS